MERNDDRSGEEFIVFWNSAEYRWKPSEQSTNPGPFDWQPHSMQMQIATMSVCKKRDIYLLCLYEENMAFVTSTLYLALSFSIHNLNDGKHDV